MLTGNFIVHMINAYQIKNIGTESASIILYQIKMLPLFLIVNILIGIAYAHGYKAFDNLTFISVSSYIFKVATVILASYLLLSETVSIKMFLGIIIIFIGIMVAK